MKTSVYKPASHAAAILLIFMLYSCMSARPLLIEIPQKSKKELPENIQSLLLVSRVVDQNYTDLDADSMQRIFYHQNFDYDTIIYDIQTVDTTLKALGDLLFESGRYDVVIPENRFLEYEKKGIIGTEMDWDEVKSLCETYQTDAILSIDFLRTRVMTEFERENYFHKIENSFFSVSKATMKVNYESLFRVYYPAEEKIIMRQFLRDTLFWEDVDNSTNLLFDRFTTVKEALAQSGVAMALDLSGSISSKWFTERRSYFAKGDASLKQAIALVDSNKWNEAIAIWKTTTENTKSKSLKSKAEYNIALGYEMLGDIDSAINWALQSFNTMYRTNTYDYLEILKRRKTETNNQ